MSACSSSIAGQPRVKSLVSGFEAGASWEKEVKKISIMCLKIIVGLWALYHGLKFLTQRTIMMFLYPAQNSIMKFFMEEFSTAGCDARRQLANQELTEQGFVVEEVVLEKNGVRYSGLKIGKKENLDSGKWVQQAVGNEATIEGFATTSAKAYSDVGFNVLLVNGPGVGRSEGMATPSSMGDAQEAGISFLENSVEAKKIVLAGHSLGGASMGQAILQHDFRKDIQYHVISQMTFDQVGNTAAKIFGQKGIQKTILKKLIFWAGCEMKTDEASEKLQTLQIPETIIQGGRAGENGVVAIKNSSKDDFMHDGVIPAKASLGRRLVKGSNPKLHKEYLPIKGKNSYSLMEAIFDGGGTPHNKMGEIFGVTTQAISRWDREPQAERQEGSPSSAFQEKRGWWSILGF